MTAEYTVTVFGETVPAERVLGRSPVTIRYGRDQARALAPVSVGEAGLEIDNRSRDYSPENSLSPLAGSVLPGGDARITATMSGTDYQLFSGRVDDLQVHPDIQRRSVTITCLDGLAALKGARVSTPLYSSLRTGEAIAAVLDAAGWPSGLRDLDAGATLVPWFWADGADAYELIGQLVASEGPPALWTADGDGRIVYRDRHHRLTRAASLTSQATLSDRVEPAFSALSYDHGFREIVNAVSYSIPIRRMSGQLQAVWASEATITVADGETVEVAASASTPFAGAITPVAGTDYQLRSGTVSMVLSRTSGQSTTVRVQATGGPAVLAGLQVRAYPLETMTTLVVSAEDALSIATYGRRSLPSSQEPAWASAHDAQAIAYLVLGHRAERLSTVSITYRAGSSETRLTQQVTRGLSDRVTIKETETVLDDEFFVEQISHRISGVTEHETIFGCEKVPAQVSDVFVLGSATNGVLGVNRLGRRGITDPATMFVLGSATNGVLGQNILAL